MEGTSARGEVEGSRGRALLGTLTTVRSCYPDRAVGACSHAALPWPPAATPLPLTTGVHEAGQVRALEEQEGCSPAATGQQDAPPARFLGSTQGQPVIAG